MIQTKQPNSFNTFLERLGEKPLEYVPKETKTQIGRLIELERKIDMEEKDNENE